jgi:hypothetical protein
MLLLYANNKNLLHKYNLLLNSTHFYEFAGSLHLMMSPFRPLIIWMNAMCKKNILWLILSPNKFNKKLKEGNFV